MKRFLFLLTLPLAAHHSLTAEFDLDRPVKIEGTVAKVEWMNPHAWVYVDVTYVDVSRTEQWAVEVGSPAELIRRGWHRTDLKQGDKVTIEAILAKKLPRTANARTIYLPNGTKVFNGRAPE